MLKSVRHRDKVIECQDKIVWCAPLREVIIRYSSDLRHKGYWFSLSTLP
jgi:hypothetical protein